MTRFEPHSHTDYSNLRLVDCINKIDSLIYRAVDLGLSGIAITDHECLSASIEVNKYAQELAKEHPDFKIALGNEIYLVDERKQGQKYYHFILIARDSIGHRMLRELSSTAWLNSYSDFGLRVPTLKIELANIIEKFGRGHLIATTACLGGELSSATAKLIEAELLENEEERAKAHQQIIEFIFFCKDLFNDDFYIECAPGLSAEQLAVNKRLRSIAECFNIKMVIGSDAHYLKKEDRYVHKAYLNSKDGEREVDSFYEYSYLMEESEVKNNIEQADLDYNLLVKNSEEIWNKIEYYSLLNNQEIVEVPVQEFEKVNKNLTKYPVLNSLFQSDNLQERYWVNECWNKLKEKNLFTEEYLERLEEEADINKVIGEKLDTCMFAYPNTLKHYINLFWECGSTVGAGRGSSCSGLNHYLLGVTQLDPLVWSLPYWR